MIEKNQDAEWVIKAKLGDKSAFNKLVLKHQNRLLTVINRYIKEPAEALDVLQETFIKAYQAINDFRGDSAFYSWLYRIAVNTAKTHLISLKKLRQKTCDDLENIEASQIEQLLNKPINKALSNQEILKRFEVLPKHLQETLTLREIAGFSYAEIAEVMNVPIGTVRSRIFRARVLLVEPAPIKNKH